MPKKRNSVDLKMLEEINLRDSLKISPRDFRKVSSQNFRKMSFDRIGNDRKSERSLGFRKASLEFKRSPDFRKYDYRLVKMFLTGLALPYRRNRQPPRAAKFRGWQSRGEIFIFITRNR